ncbi:MAG TPA: lamin tail domain-containing protein, partial [Clostridia bacterium]|nr:lamin tail domain-containing protein [Clostridia bacterium]
LFWADDLAKTDADHLDFKISADGETLRLYAANRTTILEQVTFGSQSVGISQGRAPNGSDTIVFFGVGMDTPGASNFREITSIVISEVLSHTDPPLEDAIELQNISAAPVEISHWWLSDSTSEPRKFRIPAGTILAAGDFKVYYANQFGAGASGFALNSSEGDEVALSTGDAAGNLTGSQTSVSFGALKRSVSVGRFTTSAGVDFVPLAAHTFGVDDPASLPEFRLGPGAANAGPRKSPLVINEIMHSPAGLNDEFLELHNTTAAPFPLYDPAATTNRWQLAEGVTFTFPPGTTLSAGGYLLVVAFDPVVNPVRLSSFRAQYNVPAAVPVFGPYVGALNGAGEGLTLLEPDTPEGAGSPNPGFVPYMQSERVRYSPNAPWPSGAVDTGFSLQRLDPLAYCNEPLNWTAATPTAGRANKPDADNDGMPDAWEMLHNFNRLSAADAALDADLDGMSNLNEYLTGTHPRDAASVLAIKTLKLEPGLVRIQFHAVQNRVYSLQALDALGSGSWTTLTTLPAATATGVTEFTQPVSPSATRYFRMSTVAVP